ncbi:hypothetical protein FHX82_005154 [Amycolatopsis bartoniae]|uniref:Uncharacterized protein n=1 Tax=Amycolatopsis bartoniae TaxID=941986 RepID=A0A8H9IP63_9PSEU|nr:hypothetical protein [Amycolatopsis bartoniae]MBB2938078.1 hypothetical protein [Amycolatopsis bartoniae]GHF32523.1 hypothetical protein GCM10017566_01360 [Amycolatopsis bartoniae]
MLQTAGLDLLIAWGIYFGLLALLGFFVVRGGPRDALEQVQRDPDGEPRNGDR